jgi:hypothetical protein
MTTSLGFALFGSNQLVAADQALTAVRRHYPLAPTVIISDAGADYSELASKYQADYFRSRKKISYPMEPFGYRTPQVLEFLSRMHFACSRTDTSHIMYLEEDVIILRPLKIAPDQEILGFKPCYPSGAKFPNGFPDKFLRMIYDFSGTVPNVLGYGAQGGAVLKVDTFLNNYDRITKYIEKNLDYIQDCIYPTAGWIDCFLTWYYLLAGKRYHHQTAFLEHSPGLEPESAPSWAELITNYKRYYYRNSE